MKRVANNAARTYVKTLTPFKGSNTFGQWESESGADARYVVYSYGRHWPLFVWHDGKWYENEGKYSVSTSKQHSQLHPHPTEGTELRSPADMRVIAEMGLTYWAYNKLRG